MTQQQYLSNWHDGFVNYVNQILVTIASVEMSSQATEEDKRGFEMVKVLFRGKDVQDVERDLAEGVVRQSTLDKIEKLNKDMGDIVIDHLDASPVWKQFLKQLYHLKVDNDKNAEVMRLNALGIPVFGV
jgi:hypothetical protein